MPFRLPLDSDASAYLPSHFFSLHLNTINRLITLLLWCSSGYAWVSCAGEEGFTETFDYSIMWPHSLNTLRRPWQSPHNCYLCCQIMTPDTFSPCLLISFSLPFYRVTLSTWGPMGRRGSLLTVSVAKLFQQLKKTQKLQSYIHASVSCVWLKWELLWKLFIRTMLFFWSWTRSRYDGMYSRVASQAITSPRHVFAPSCSPWENRWNT